MKRTHKWILAVAFGIAAIALIVLLRTVDTAPIGPDGATVGLSHFNRAVFEFFGVHLIWYDITDWLGVAAVLTAAVFAVAGLIEWIRRKSLFKVDRELLILGGLYLIVIGLYLLFELCPVNVRPILLPGSTHPAPSFPSSHTMIVCVIMGSTMTLIPRYIRQKRLCRLLQILCAVVIGVTIVGRLIAGVHWATDILGGCLIAAALWTAFSAAIQKEET
ncbi:MAG: phosphatase PAP2 family protein [Clostridia bacterium]|nr:phosphatase PAP2 family protein [Clostridia bacterium]